MDELQLLRSTRDDTTVPSPGALAAGRTALLERASGADIDAVPERPRRRTRARALPRLAVGMAAVAAVATGVLVVGTLNVQAQSAHAAEVLRTAAAEASTSTVLQPADGQYLRSLTRASWMGCSSIGWNEEEDHEEMSCSLTEQIIDVYMPADPDAEWVLVRDWGNTPGGGVITGERVETDRAVGGRFYDAPDGDASWLGVELSEIPLDGEAAYRWIDGRNADTSDSRDRANFTSILGILRTGLLPAAQQAALLDALARIPGVTATEGVANLDGVVGVAIGRNDPMNSDARTEIIIDPSTGLVIGERSMTGPESFGFILGPSELTALTAIRTTLVDSAP